MAQGFLERALLSELPFLGSVVLVWEDPWGTQPWTWCNLCWSNSICFLSSHCSDLQTSDWACSITGQRHRVISSVNIYWRSIRPLGYKSEYNSVLALTELINEWAGREKSIWILRLKCVFISSKHLRRNQDCKWRTRLFSKKVSTLLIASGMTIPRAKKKCRWLKGYSHKGVK